MKNYLLGIVIAVSAITFSAFSSPEPTRALNGEKWFELRMGGDKTEPQDYDLYGDGSFAPACSGKHVCAILAVPNTGVPETPNLATVIDTKYRPNK